MAEPASLRHLISRWRDDPGGTYRSWFLWEERLKNFRSIRRGIATVVEEMEAGTPVNDEDVSSRAGAPL
jgi:type II restriction enzyme